MTPAAFLEAEGVEPGAFVAVALATPGQIALAVPGRSAGWAVADASTVVREIEERWRPRWVVWSRETYDTLHTGGARLRSCWDVAAVHRLIWGGWRAEPGRVWARSRGLPLEAVPEPVDALDLFSTLEDDRGDTDDPVRTDGHLRGDWGGPAWEPTPDQLARWAALALTLAEEQRDERATRHERPRASMVARSESATELLCVELAHHGLPFDRAMADEALLELIGPRPANEAEAAEIRRGRDAEVLQHAPDDSVDLRSPGQVKSLLRRVGIEVPDTRAWRLESLTDQHPVVEALLRWRKAERIATTFGYSWIDECVGDDDRLRGSWTGCDGAAGRMTATAGLHNMSSELRSAIAAEGGHVFVRADLGQIEPRVLAAVSGDTQLAIASAADDLYAGVAATLGFDRDVAKVAVLGAMYGQTTGRGAQAMAELRRAYPTAIDFLERADHDARRGIDLVTYGGRRVRMDSRGDFELPESAARSRSAARGRYGRNAMIQGAAAELFKLWAVTVRARATELDASIVLCLHDELLVHAPTDAADDVAKIVDTSLQEAVARWAPDRSVRFLADTTVIHRWSDAKH